MTEQTFQRAASLTSVQTFLKNCCHDSTCSTLPAASSGVGIDSTNTRRCGMPCFHFRTDGRIARLTFKQGSTILVDIPIIRRHEHVAVSSVSSMARMLFVPTFQAALDSSKRAMLGKVWCSSWLALAVAALLIFEASWVDPLSTAFFHSAPHPAQIPPRVSRCCAIRYEIVTTIRLPRGSIKITNARFSAGIYCFVYC